jgi:hypothetical protein
VRIGEAAARCHLGQREAGAAQQSGCALGEHSLAVALRRQPEALLEGLEEALGP